MVDAKEKVRNIVPTLGECLKMNRSGKIPNARIGIIGYSSKMGKTIMADSLINQKVEQGFVQSVDYQILRKDAENAQSGRPTNGYHLSVPCLEFFIARKVRDVLRAIRTMEPAWAKVAGRNFALSEYKDTTGRTLPMYELSKLECLYIATKFNDEARAKLVIRWE